MLRPTHPIHGEREKPSRRKRHCISNAVHHRIRRLFGTRPPKRTLPHEDPIDQFHSGRRVLHPFKQRMYQNRPDKRNLPKVGNDTDRSVKETVLIERTVSHLY